MAAKTSQNIYRLKINNKYFFFQIWLNEVAYEI